MFIISFELIALSNYYSNKFSAISSVVKKLNKLDVTHVGTFQAYIGLSGTQEDLKLPTGNYIYFKNNDVYEVDKYLR